ncbi:MULTISPECIES: NAD(P)/FAD-dependent oxidoreductase [unclassified Salinibacterium]|uniref:NAD(P)/FAD-dependent oxidoreductase n=1 Tax=unclassified Salinibacterium TaxID=2632331 RepID=UPI0018CE5504|nr:MULTISPECIES: FAD-dependent oxidoreductase [unclassified Salinibacterium]MBH0024824.1 FAD-dependent oxidoreductase [Salinibacterium sp. SWN248]MBH0054827.1 FAD-dependent oxidoreductase [Salinibacterium sp. SWN139]MBH0084028.1 FAD-dependent oxidoreductase [Salinibacterium sp. SWN167]
MTNEAGAGLVVVGASLAGLRAVESARRGGYTDSITLIGAEIYLPYDRPPLSKGFLAEGASPDYFLTEEELRTELNVDLRLGTFVDGVDTERKVVTVGDQEIPYERLIIATGAEPRVLAHLPAIDGILTLRTLEDARQIRDAIGEGSNLVVIGAGFIGSEIASSAQARGATVTVIEAAPVPLVRAVGEVVGKAISALHGRNGTRLLTSVQIDEVIGTDHVEAVRLNNGEIIPADLIIVGVGAAPATSWLADSGLEMSPIDGGIVCDAFMQTSAEGVYAAGDVAHWPNGLMDSTMRLENWTNAADQGTQAATNALFSEKAKKYETVPYFWSDWYGNRIQFVGTAIADSVSFVSGGPDEDKFVALYRAGDRLVGVATLNEPRRIMKYRRFIAERGDFDRAGDILQPATAASSSR